MDSEDRTWKTSTEASAGPNRGEEAHGTTQQLCTPATLNNYAQTSLEESLPEPHSDPTADAGSRETTAQPTTPPQDESGGAGDRHRNSEDELDSLFDADLEASFEAFEALSSDEEDDEAAEQHPTPEEAEEKATTWGVAPYNSATEETPRTPTETPPLPEQPAFSKSAIPPNNKALEQADIDLAPKDWFGPTFEQDLDGGLGYFQGWAPDDEAEDGFEHRWTLAESEEDVSGPDAVSSDAPSEEEPHTYAMESPSPTRPAEQPLDTSTYVEDEESPMRDALEEVLAKSGSTETVQNACNTSLNGSIPSDGNTTGEHDRLAGVSVPEKTQHGRVESHGWPATALPSAVQAPETTAQLLETSANQASTDMDGHATRADQVLPNYSTSVAECSSALERPRTESQAVFSVLGEYLAASPFSAKTRVQPSTASSAGVHMQEHVHVHNDEPPVEPATEPPAGVPTQKPTAQPRASPATSMTGVPVETQAKQASHDDSDSLPDYESLPDYLDGVPEIVPAPQDTRSNAAKHPQIEVAEPTPRLPAQQAEASSPDSVASNAKRRRSAASASPRHTAKRIRIVLKRTPSPQPPRGEAEGGSSTNRGAVEANKRRRSSDPGPGLVTKRPRIVLKRKAPQPDPPTAAAQDAPPAHPSIPSQGPSQKASQAWLEDQISPSTVVHPAEPAEEVVPPKKSTRRAKPPPVDKPSTSNLTWAAVESLLPTSALGQASWIRRRFWTVKEEVELRNAWTEDDERSLGISHAEVLVGRFVTQLYGCQLADLFRYGLKYVSAGPDRKGNPTDEQFWVNLLRLLPHPFFLGRIEVLRYVLQAAVYYRTSDFAADNLHVHPFMPPWSGKEPGYIAWLKELRAAHPAGSSGHATKTFEILQAAEFRCRTQVESKMWMQELCVVMDTWADRFAAKFPEEETDPLGFYLFLLTERDLAFVEACLDELDRDQRRCQEQRPLTWQEQHSWREDYYPPAAEIPHVEEHRGYHGADVEFALHPPAPPPPEEKNVPLRPVTVDSAFLRFWTAQPREARFVAVDQKALYRAEKRLAVLAERREALIRSKVAGGAEGGAAAVETHTVLDVPPFDPDPDFHLFGEVAAARAREEGPNAAPAVPNEPGLMVVRGVYTTPATAEWLARWRRRKAEEEGGSGRRRNPRRMVRMVARTPDSAVGRVLGSGYVPAVEGGGDRGPEAVAGPSAAQSVGGVAARPDHGGGDRAAARQVADARTSIVQQEAAYRRAYMAPAILSMGGGLWARRKGRKAIGQ